MVRRSSVSAGRARALSFTLAASRPTPSLFLIPYRLAPALSTACHLLFFIPHLSFSPLTNRQQRHGCPSPPATRRRQARSSASTQLRLRAATRHDGQPLAWGDGLAVRHHTPSPLAFALHAPTRPCYERRPVAGDWHSSEACCNLRPSKLEPPSRRAATRQHRAATGAGGDGRGWDCWSQRREVLQPVSSGASTVRGGAPNFSLVERQRGGFFCWNRPILFATTFF